MSTTRKIEGIANLTDNDEITLSIEPNTSPVHIYKEPATLVIGGKCLTEEEHEAEFQRRAKAMLVDLLRMTEVATTQAGDKIEFVHTHEVRDFAAKHNVQLP